MRISDWSSDVCSSDLLKRTRIDSGMSSGMTPVAAANATRPEPAGNEIPIGKRVWESPPVPTVSGSNMRFNQLWMMPSPGRRDTQIGRAHVELQSLMRISYAVFCLKKKKKKRNKNQQRRVEHDTDIDSNIINALTHR